MDRKVDVAVVGGGIVGLAHAYLALKRGLRVVLFERDTYAVGASVRNFGMVWPIGQSPGKNLNYALKSRAIWLELAAAARFWINENGSLHLAYHEDEINVLREFNAMHGHFYASRILEPEEVSAYCPSAKRQHLRGALYNKSECIVYAREAIRRIPLYMNEQLGLDVRFGELVKSIANSVVTTSAGKWEAGQVIVCSGADFQTLYPELFSQSGMTKCKLQMMKVVPDKPVVLGPSLCAGLTLRHYKAFADCPSLKLLDKRYDEENAVFKKHGIHVLVSQNQHGELIVGDSHHYGDTLEPFDLEDVNQLILDYLDSFLDVGQYKVTERWNGVYPKYLADVKFIARPEKNVTIVNGLGGAGMTLSFGIADEVISSIFG